ncbi:hypothetical protein AOC36_07205 [Erysipelothrix larvae]|uniref:Beta-methylgalactoside transporter n=1 Tax=Erysipelothrix larvae TaxID=1514105 RepID=A0A0X8H0E9_9FIRM|nr:beta-methylgalactoside transporter [Erysipelothrix larvae]AMC93777.1 hypothetical protein AOC36_07205 [Erysipelothrix larvae]
MNNLKQMDLKSFLSKNAITIILFVMVAFVAINEPNFLSIANIRSVSTNVAVRFIVALGISGCLIVKGTDLSAGRIIGLGAVVAASLLQRYDYADKFFPWAGDYNIFAILLLIVVITTLLGMINGIVIAYFSVPPFIATLGMQVIVYGINLIYSKGQPIGALKPEFSRVATGNLFGIPYLVIIATVIGLIVSFAYRKTRYGKYMYAIGGNENAAEVSGVNVKRSKIKIYALAGLFYGIAGFLLSAKSGGGSISYGTGYELEAIAAATIGGVSTTGGVGSVSGVLTGVLVFELMKTALQFMGIDTAMQSVIQGVIIIVAVAVDIRKYIAKK